MPVTSHSWPINLTHGSLSPDTSSWQTTNLNEKFLLVFAFYCSSSYFYYSWLKNQSFLYDNLFPLLIQYFATVLKMPPTVSSTDFINMFLVFVPRPFMRIFYNIEFYKQSWRMSLCNLPWTLSDKPLFSLSLTLLAKPSCYYHTQLYPHIQVIPILFRIFSTLIDELYENALQKSR